MSPTVEEASGPQSLPAVLRRRAAVDVDRPFVDYVDGPSLTYGTVYEESLRWADAFSHLDLGANDRVVTMMPASRASLLAWLGLSWLRAVDVGANNDYRGRMLGYLLENSGARVAVIAERYLDRLGGLDATAKLDAVVVPDASGPIPDVGCRVIDQHDFLAGARATSLEPPEPWDTSCMIYTSGTTGPSKGVVIPWGHLHAQATGTFGAGELCADDVYYSPFPPFHGGGRMPALLMASLNGRLVVRESFSGRSFWDDVRHHGCTTTALLGAMTAFLVAQPPSDGDADNPLRNVVMFPVIADHETFCRRFGVRIRTVFSMTEISVPIATGWEIVDHRSCGRLRDGYPGVEVRIVDDHDYEVPVGVLGELIVRTSDPWTMNAGYFGMPDKTAEAWRNGWFHSGDAFRRDEDGNFFFVDRIKDAIRRRGENISSFEVEAHVCDHPEVAECAAIAMPSEWGEDEVKIVVVPREGSTLEPRALIEFLIPRMPRFMVPRYVEIVRSLPKTDATLRVKKAELRCAPATSSTWDREAAGVEVPR